MSTPPATPPPAPGGGQTFTVNKDNVLTAGKAISQAVDVAYEKLDTAFGSMIIQAPAGDDISTASAEQWNKNLVGNDDSHYRRLRQYIDSVRDLAKQLEGAAKQYGYTDEEIADAFKTQEKKA